MAFFSKIQLPPLFHRSGRARPQDSSQQLTMSLTNKGLLNPSGHNNCFLNSCVQVLWHVDVFRRSFREFKGHTCIGNSCIFCALQALFTQFQHSSQSALPPDDLRQALAHCYQEQHRFQLGIMDDAAECFEKIMEQIHFHLTGSDDLDSCSAPHCLPHQKCALSVLEMTECLCGETSEPLAFVQFVHYISAASLGVAARRVRQDTSHPAGDGGVFGALVRGVSGEGEGRECTTCHRVTPMKKMLLNNPDLVCIGMIWDSDQPDIDDIMNVVESIGTILRVSDMFHRVMSDASSTEYCLSGMVAYYGHHYCTFCYHTVLREWGFFDDANFRSLSSNWSDVVELCRKAHYQPLLLVYTNPFADNITMTTAPTEVTKVVVTGNKPNSLASVTEEDEVRHALKTSSEQVPVKPTENNLTPSSKMPDPAYEIDPNTLSIRPVGRSGTGLYPQLSGVRNEIGGMAPASSAPLQQTQSSSTRQRTTNPPLVQSSSSATTLPPSSTTTAASRPMPLFPVVFQASPSAPPLHRGPSYLASHSVTSTTPSNVALPPLLTYNRPQYNPLQQRASNALPARHPRPNMPAYTRPYPLTNAGNVYPNATQQLSSLHTDLQHQTASQTQSPTGQTMLQTGQNQAMSGQAQSQTGLTQSPTGQTQSKTGQTQVPSGQTRAPTFFQRSYPLSSPLSKKLPSVKQPQARTAGPSSLPGSPAKYGSEQQRANSVQPGAMPATSTPAPIARPRPSPPHSVPPPNQSDKMTFPQPEANRDLIEFSLSPALWSPTQSNQSQLTQGPTPPHHLSPRNNNQGQLSQGPTPPYHLSPRNSNQGQLSQGPTPPYHLSPGNSNQGQLSQGPTPPYHLSPGNSNQAQISRGPTLPHHLSPGNSSLLSSSPSSRSSREFSPYTPDSSVSSVEGDLIQWSLTPDMLQKIQRKYRGRQDIRQSSTDSLNPSTGDTVSGRASSSNMTTRHGVEVTGNPSERIEKPVTGSSSDNVLVDVSESIERNKKGGEIVGLGLREAPDPLYADPDVVQTMLKSIAETTPEDKTIGTSSQRQEPLPESSWNGDRIRPGMGMEPDQKKDGARPGMEQDQNGSEGRLGLGEDPLYAVPKQVMARMRAKQVTAEPAEDDKKITAPHSDIPASVQPVLLEALEAWRRAESKKESDITLAKMSYSRAATLLMKVLLDPAVAKDQTLRHNISHKRTQALSKCSEMSDKLNQRLKHKSVYGGGTGSCSQCGLIRQLNTHQICGPCHLKNKINH